VTRYSNDDSAGVDLADRLSSINSYMPTDLCVIMKGYQSDKGMGRHNYTTVYFSLLSEMKDNSLNIFELGLGTNNPNVPSTMGVAGKPGASLRGWYDFFPNSQIFGADIDRDILFNEERIKTHYCDQLDATAIKEMWQAFGDDIKYDVILEDGLHTFDANISFLDHSLHKLNKGGFFIVEDIRIEEYDNWAKRIKTHYLKKFPNHTFLFVEIPRFKSVGAEDNNLLIVLEN